MIGKGGFGEVFTAKHRREEKFYAIKMIIIPLDLDTKLEENKFFQEVKSMVELNHKNIIRYYVSWIEDLPDELHMSLEKIKLKELSKR